MFHCSSFNVETGKMTTRVMILLPFGFAYTNPVRYVLLNDSFTEVR